ncbi:MAG: hypothetical protein J6Q39_03355 [Bacteroidales bacterium]|nr:hypothetical protein [Bacteroidales bacterium]
MAMEENKMIAANEYLEKLMDAALADGVLTEKEKQILFRKAETLGVDLDEFEMVLDARLFKLHNNKTALDGINEDISDSVAGNTSGEFQNKHEELMKKKEELMKKKEELLRKRDEILERTGMAFQRTVVSPAQITNDDVTSNVVIQCNKYMEDYNNIKKLRPIGQVIKLPGRRTKYNQEEIEDWKYKENKRMENECREYIATILPQTDSEVINALDLLLNLLPSASIEILLPRGYFNDYYEYDRELVQRVVPKIKTIITESEDVYSGNNAVMTKIKVAKERLYAIVNVLEENINSCNEKLANSDDEFNEKRQAFEKMFTPYIERRKKTWIIFAASLILPWFLAGCGWGWSLVLDILVLGGWFLWLVSKGEDNIREFKEVRDSEFTEQDKFNAENKLKKSIELSRKELRFFKL